MTDSNQFQNPSLLKQETIRPIAFTWRDKLVWDDKTYHLASFRGAKFYVETTNTEVGRRNVIHQYPYRDLPYVEDLGQDADIFAVNGYIIQSKRNSYNHFPERNKLIEALRTKGSGTLIHPFYGNLEVNVTGKSSISESLSRDGGIAKFTMTFVQSGVNKYPSQVVDPIGSVDKVAKDTFNSCADSAANQYDYASRSENTMTNDLTSFKGMTKSVLSKIKSPVSGSLAKAATAIDDYTIADYIDTGVNLVNMVTGVLNNPLSLIGIPSSIIKGDIGTWSAEYIGSILEYPINKISPGLGTSLVRAFIAIKDFGKAIGSSSASNYGGTVSVKSVSSPTTARETLNQQVLINTVKSISMINAVKVGIRTEYTSYEDANKICELVSDTIDEILTDFGDEAARTDFDDYDLNYEVDDVFIALDKMKSAFVLGMKQIGANLADVVNYKVPPVVTPAIVLAYNKYKDISRDEEIVNRNLTIADHPGFLPEGQEVEILSE